MSTCLKEAKKCRKEEEAMTHATLEREKDAAARRLQEEAAKATAAAGMMQPTVVSPPPALNLNTLLTGHVGQDTNGMKEDGAVLAAMDDKVSGENGKPPKQKKIRKSKLNKEEKDDAVTKKECCSSALKQGSIAVPLPTMSVLRGGSGAQGGGQIWRIRQTDQESSQEYSASGSVSNSACRG